MPTLANLRQQFSAVSSTNDQSTSVHGESLITDTRCRISPVQAVERKLGMMLGRDKSPLGLSWKSAKQQFVG